MRAALNLPFVVLLLVLSWHASPTARAGIALLVVVLLYRPVMYFFLPPLFMLVLIILVKLPHRQKAEYPCPVCGYDVRETLSRCPECGTELQWGQLPDGMAKPRRPT